MSFVQIFHDEPGNPASGADLRRAAIKRALERSGEVRTVVVAQAQSGKTADARPRGLSRMVRRIHGPTIAALAETLRAAPPRAVICDSVLTLLTAERLRAALPGVPMVMDFHNIESDLMGQQLRAGARGPLRPLQLWQAGRAQAAVAQAEARAAALVDQIWCCSPADLARAQDAFPGTSLQLVPNPVPWDAPPLPPAPPGTRFLFVGYVSYPPNLHAARRLTQTLLPALRTVLPGATVTIAGREASALRAPETPGLRVIDSPADLRPLYAEASAVLLPIAEGGGTRLKVLEALAAGRPIIATDKAVEGLGLIPGTHYLRATSDAEFVAAAMRLAQGERLGADLRAAGLALVARDHGPEVIPRAVAAALAALPAPV